MVGNFHAIFCLEMTYLLFMLSVSLKVNLVTILLLVNFVGNLHAFVPILLVIYR